MQITLSRKNIPKQLRQNLQNAHEAHRKHRTAVVVDADRTVIAFRNGLDDGKPDAVFSAFSLVESLKYMGQVTFGNARSIVGNRDEHAAFFRSAG